MGVVFANPVHLSRMTTTNVPADKPPAISRPTATEEDAPAPETPAERSPATTSGKPLHRTALVNVDNKEYCDNTISTYKYSAISFVPRSLFEQ